MCNGKSTNCTKFQVIHELGLLGNHSPHAKSSIRSDFECDSNDAVVSDLHSEKEALCCRAIGDEIHALEKSV
jgi:hypothetical protein